MTLATSRTPCVLEDRHPIPHPRHSRHSLDARRSTILASYTAQREPSRRVEIVVANPSADDSVHCQHPRRHEPHEGGEHSNRESSRPPRSAPAPCPARITTCGGAEPVRWQSPRLSFPRQPPTLRLPGPGMGWGIPWNGAGRCPRRALAHTPGSWDSWRSRSRRPRSERPACPCHSSPRINRRPSTPGRH